jgi:hypothetical protein
LVVAVRPRPSRRSLCPQAAQRLQIPDVQRIGGDAGRLAGRRRLLRLDEQRQTGEAAIVQQPPERLETQTALPDVLVPIDAAASRLLRVVRVDDPHP